MVMMDLRVDEAENLAVRLKTGECASLLLEIRRLTQVCNTFLLERDCNVILMHIWRGGMPEVLKLEVRY
jgi:hypothetical protein